MKWISILALACACANAQQFYTGQAARLVIGQKPFTAQEPGASDKLLGSIGGVAFGGDTLLVADSNRIGGSPINHRVLTYRNVSTFIPGPRDPFPQGDKRCPACVGIASNVIGQPDFSKTDLKPTAQNTVRAAVGVAYNGRYLAVADTDNNRVLIWKSLPTTDFSNADFVVGQPDFKTVAAGTSATKMRGPEGVWLDANNGLWVADTSNSRVLYFGEVTQNNQAAKFVLGQPNLDGNLQRDLYPNYVVKADTMLNPTSVTSDGTKLYVADLGMNRVLIWNSIPSRNGQPADVAVGQPDMESREANNNSKLCASNGESGGKPTYPDLCAATLSYPRSVISDGKRLFVADGGNDRVLIWNEIPRENGKASDVTIGQQSPELNQASDSAEPGRVSATDSFRTPTSLAWDGVNLYVADTYNRRVLVYTPGDFGLPLTAVRNAASPTVYAIGNVVFSGTLTENDELTIKIGNDSVKDDSGNVVAPKEYKVKVLKNDSFSRVIDAFVDLINAGGGDPNVIASPNKDFNALILTARADGPLGNSVSLGTAITPETSKTAMTTSGANLKGGQDAARIAPFAIITVLGENLADETVPALPLDKPLPTELGGVQLFIDGIQCPIIGTAPDHILAQLPVESSDSTSATAVLRVKRKDGRVTMAAATPIPIIAQNPGVYNSPTVEPSPGLAYHFSSSATGTVSIDGSANAGDSATVIIRDREYTYKIQTNDTKEMVRDALVALINASDPEVEAYAGVTFQRVRLRARIPGPEGNGIPIGGKSNEAGSIIVTAYNSQLCCANEAGALINAENPAVPGETIVVLASGLGVVGPQEARDAMINGQPYNGPELNEVSEFVSSLAGGKTANVLFAGLKRGYVGTYEVHLELNPDIPTNPRTEVTIAQSYQVSNVFTIHVLNPKKQD